MAVAIHVEFELSSSSACLTAYTGIVLSHVAGKAPEVPDFGDHRPDRRCGWANVADSQQSR
jgi:predicted aconitase